MDKLNLDKRTLKKFGITMGIAFLVLTGLVLLRQKQVIFPTVLLAGLFFILAFTNPVLLKLAYIAWMKLAFLLSWINTRIILFIIFYLLFTPIGLAMRLLGKDLIDRKIEKNRESYWKKKDKGDFNPLDYERQF